jgi:putative two-component system response regulator
MVEKSDRRMVLLVDDDEPTCTLITALLQKDFLIEVATDGLEAIEKLRVKTYSAIILDLLMPHVDGYAVLDFLKENNPAMLPSVLVVTAALTRADMNRVREYPVCGVVGKPFELDALLNGVKQCAGPAASRGKFLTSGMILLLADFLRNRM